MDTKKYRIFTYWYTADCGYRYSIVDSEGNLILESKEAYWYEENARKAAEQETETL